MSRQKILTLALLTLVLMGLGGIVLTALFGIRDLPVVFSIEGLGLQVIWGLGYGFVSAIVAWWIVSLPYLAETRSFFTGLLRNRGLTWLDVVLISACAGIGEEILFRVLIQAYLGVWITSIVFVAIHGYLNPFNKPLFIYGLFMIFAIAGIGYMMETLGIYSAMVSHTVIDVFLLGKLVRPKDIF